MKYKGFYDEDQVRNYMGSSVIRYKNEPIYICGAYRTGDEYTIEYFHLADKDQQKRSTSLDHKDIDLSPVPLGMVYWKRRQDINLYNTIVASRIPRRMWKIGLHKDSLCLAPVAGRALNRERAGIFIHSHRLARTIRGKYHSFEKCLSITNESEIGSVLPFCRVFAIGNYHPQKGYTLIHSREKEAVGRVSEDGAWELYDRYIYLKESLEGEINVSQDIRTAQST